MLGYNGGQMRILVKAARDENAPDNAVCKNQDGTWCTIEQVQNQAAKVACLRIHKELLDKAGG